MTSEIRCVSIAARGSAAASSPRRRTCRRAIPEPETRRILVHAIRQGRALQASPCCLPQGRNPSLLQLSRKSSNTLILMLFPLSLSMKSIFLPAVREEPGRYSTGCFTRSGIAPVAPLLSHCSALLRAIFSPVRQAGRFRVNPLIMLALMAKLRGRKRKSRLLSAKNRGLSAQSAAAAGSGCRSQRRAGVLTGSASGAAPNDAAWRVAGASA
jgi:hypothetical protein